MKSQNIRNSFIKIATLLFTTAILNQSALAGTNSPNIDKVQANQKHRIAQGLRSGELTGKEAWRLGKQQGKIYNKEARLKADGKFTRRERARIHFDLAKSSHSIYKQKHDRQTQSKVGNGIKGINKRQHQQKKRIRQGVRSGELTPREAASLGKQQLRIQNKKRRFKADGSFTRRERARVHKNQNRSSKRIYRLKHNNRKRK